MWIGAGAPHNFWEIGAKATCTNPEKGATVRTAKNQGWFWIILDWKVTNEATETEEGSRERGCAVCEYVQTEAIPATETGEPTDSTDPTDSSDSQGQQDPSGDTGSPQTGDSSNMMLWISLMLASCGGVLGMLLYRRKKAAAGK